MIRGRGGRGGAPGGRGRGRGRGTGDGPPGDDDDDRDDEHLEEETAFSSLATREPPPTWPPMWNADRPPRTIHDKQLTSKESFIARQSITIEKLFRNSPYFIEPEPPTPEIDTWFNMQKPPAKKKKPSEEIQFTPALFPLELLPEHMRPKRDSKPKADKIKKVFEDLQAGEQEEANKAVEPEEKSREDELEENSRYSEDSGSIESQDEEDDKWKQNDDDDEGDDDMDDKDEE